jgi:hypothetical protein
MTVQIISDRQPYFNDGSSAIVQVDGGYGYNRWTLSL